MHNRSDGIPYPPRLPLAGNLFSLNPKAVTQSLIELARKYGPIFELQMPDHSAIIVSSAELVDDLCDQKRFDKSLTGVLGRGRRFAGDGLFTATTDEPNWRKAHNILLPNFRQAAMQSYHSAMLDAAEQVILKWQRLNAEEDIDVVHDMTAVTLETIGICGFGYRFNSFYREGPHPFVSAMSGALEATMMERGLPLEETGHRAGLAAPQAGALA